MIDLQELLNSFTEEDIIEIMQELGADRYVVRPEAIIFPTICHNEDAAEASLKLYYYKDSKLFHCYTDCSSNFNLINLIQKVWELKGLNFVQTNKEKKKENDFCFFDIVKFLLAKGQGDFSSKQNGEVYRSDREKLKKKDRLITLPTYPESVLDIFERSYPTEWIEEGISTAALSEYHILYSVRRNKIIIPHYDVNSNLVGIRGRALNKDEVKEFGKYMPVEIEKKWYAHPLGQNLYGLNLVQDNIKKLKKVVIFEGEKSCLKYFDYFGKDNNIAVACCGSSINKAQIDLLMKTCAPLEIVIAFDKEFENGDYKGEDKYFQKLYSIGQKYNKYANFSIIFDHKGLLGLKDSPVDRGIEVYKQLFKERVIVK